jgi:HSP20 family protein
LSEKKREKTGKAIEKKEVVPAKPRKRPASTLELAKPANLMLDFDRAFNRFRRDFESILWPEFPRLSELETKAPTIDVEDKGDRFILTAEVPGFKKDEVEISICGETVEISGSKEQKKDEKTKDYVKRERSSESFYRKTTLPEEIKFEEVKADLKDGLLEIELPKKAPKQRRKIQIK